MTTIQQLQQQNTQLTQQVNQLTQQVNQLTQRIDQLNRTIQGHDADNRRNRAEIDRLHRENLSLSRQATRTICQRCSMRCN